jgi:putative endonuclease
MSKGIPWTIVFTREFKTRSEAYELEMKIKSRGARRFLEDNHHSAG